MNNPAFFSIIIPTYNRADLILKTINSVLQQTFIDYEIIVVDNRSTDNTKDVLAPYIEAGKIKFIRHDKNYERAKSRNTGMENAIGKFVTFLDSDDLMYKDNLKDAYSFIQTHPQYHIFHNLYELIDENSLVLYKYRYPSIKHPLKTIASGNFFSCIGVFISSEIYKKFRFDTTIELQGIEDWEFWMRILADYVPGRINKINSGIVHHQGRSTTNYDIENYLKKKDYVLNKLKNNSHLRSRYGKYFHLFNASCYLLTASLANSNGLFNYSRKFCLKAFLIQPGLLFNFRFLRITQKALLKIKHQKNI